MVMVVLKLVVMVMLVMVTVTKSVLHTDWPLIIAQNIDQQMTKEVHHTLKNIARIAKLP